MNLTFTIPDPDVPAFSTQFESRTPIARDPRTNDPTETPADHVARALGVWVNQELDAARKIAADAAITAAETDAELSSALLAAEKLRRGETATAPVTTTR